jgi:transmembrane sensor
MEINNEILHKYLIGETSDEENAEIVRWADEDPEHVAELKALGIVYDASIWNQDNNSQDRKYIPFRKRLLSYSIKAAKIAAVLAVGVFLTYFVQQLTYKPKMLSFYTPAGQRAELTLEDGTHIWLNANSKITYPSTFDKSHRDVILEGEAYFNVIHEQHRPFTVKAGGYQVKVLGTEFNIKAYKNQKYEIDLIRGSVHVTTPNNEESDLKPGNRIFVQEKQILKGNIEHPEQLEWKNGLISFNEETLGDIFNKIELFYDIRIDCKNASLLDSHYSGKFRVRDGVDHIMKVLQIDNNFNYSISSDRSTVTIK